MKKKDSSCVRILSDQGEAATVLNLSEFLFSFYRPSVQERVVEEDMF